MDTGQWVAMWVWLAFTGMFTALFVMGMMRTTRKKWPDRPILSDEERAQWEQIERHWQ